jgi:diaminohydroxyphosphoribosylaminopyrimidine deaminase / 5-amino-6-(5-phosphoribosylamino)uracil reductase
MFSDFDHQSMALALQLAERGRYTTRPNPMVGCVLTQGLEIVGQGFHQRAGGPHAEVFALNQAGERARGACAYVTLEPCAHFGRTPPCAVALLQAGVARVVVAAVDSFSEVDGRGIAQLRAAGIRVDVGLMEAPARAQNCGFFSRIERQRPWVRLKMAMSLDGKTALANGKSQWLTGPEARADVQRLRAQAGAIVTGIGTVLADDPRLSVRDPHFADAPQPLKVVLDRHLRTPPTAQLFDGAGQVVLAHGTGVLPNTACAKALHFALPEACAGQLPALLKELASTYGVNEVLIEAGAILAGAFLQAGLVDELVIYQAALVLGAGSRGAFALGALNTLDQAFRFCLVETRAVGADLRLIYRPQT